MRRREPAVDFQSARAARLHGLPDREVLRIAARDGRVLISHDVTTMAEAFWAETESGLISPGLILVSQSAAIGPVVESIVLSWVASDADEWRNGVFWFPL